MLQRASRFAGASVFRRFTTGCTEAPAAEEAEQMFREAWSKMVPYIDPPKTPLSFIKPRPQLTTSIPSKLTLNLYLPHSSDLFVKEFVCFRASVTTGGFVFVHPNSVADIVTLEAVPTDRIDPTLVEKGLAEFSQKLSSATTDCEKVEAQIGVDVYTALQSALTG